LALGEAPGAKAARTCGLLSILCAITCIGIPVAIVLGIVALVQQAKAKRLARDFPQDYRLPTASGMVMGIAGLVMPLIMLPFVGIVSAIAIPAFLHQQQRAVNKVISNNLMSQLDTLVSEYGKGKEVGLDQPAIHASLERILRAATERNPANSEAPAFRYSIAIVAATSEEEAAQQAEAEATTTGEVVFVLGFPADPQQSAYLAGAAMLKVPADGSNTTTHAVTLD
jgi:uncharacterized membrane protein